MNNQLFIVACRRDPELLMVPCEEVAAALLHLKLALPALDILELVKRKPSLLRDKVLAALAYSTQGCMHACAVAVSDRGLLSAEWRASCGALHS